MRVGGITNIGMVREINQDSFAARQDLGVYVVADGMGGHAAGEQASSSAVRTIIDVLSRYDFETNTYNGQPIGLEDVLRLAMQEANQQILLEALNDQALEGMGTTAVVAVDRQSELVIGHIGDSRVYRIRGDVVDQLTEDHSVVQQLVRAGAISLAEAQVHPYKNVITRCLGMQNDVEADVFRIPLEAGDRFVLCSDGLSNLVSPSQIQEVVAASDDPEQACQLLVNLANGRGGNDNITVVLLYNDRS